MATKKKVSIVEESSSYENCLDFEHVESFPATLGEFIGVSKEEELEEWKKQWVGMPEFVNEDNKDKIVTQALKGGNTAEFYAKEGTMNKSQMLVNMHPDVSKVVWRFGRWHHYVDYSPFKNNKPILKSGIQLPSGTDEYGMKLIKKDKL